MQRFRNHTHMMEFLLLLSRVRAHTPVCLAALFLPSGLWSQVMPDSAAPAQPVPSVQPATDSVAPPSKGWGAVRSVSLINAYQIERERLGELAGAPLVAPMTLRSVSAYITRLEPSTRRRGLFLPELQLVHNSALPWSMNDGDLWAGRGASYRIAGGLYSRHGRFQLIVAPEITYQANRYFQLHIPEIERVTIPPDRSKWAFPWYVSGPYSADMPTRFGDTPIGRLSLGQSSLLVGFSKFQFGFANENHWWGPGIGNALVLSNNAPGFPHFLLRTREPVKTRIGDIDIRWIVGGLTESSYFDTTSTNNLNSITAGALTLHLRKPRGLTVGVTRSVIMTASGWGKVPVRWLELFHPIGWPNRIALRDSTLDPGGRDQLYSLFARWVMPESGFEVYGEWGRTEFPPSLRNFILAPNHTQAYTLGLQWRRPGWTGNDLWRLQAENTSVEQSATFRDRPVGIWYTSRKVLQGYTNRGQPLGAAIGPGSSGQNVNIDYMRPDWSFGLKAGRIRYNEDVRSISAYLEFKSWCTHDIYLYWGPRLAKSSRFGFAALDFTLANRIQPWFQFRGGCPGGDGQVDIRNNTLNLTWSPFARR